METQENPELLEVEVKPEIETVNCDNSATNPILKVFKRRVRCPECHRYTAETEEKMLRHVRKVHRGENPFQCALCDYSTYNKSLFEEHVRIHQGIKPFKCNFCPYASASKKNAKKHEAIHRPDNPLRCDLCGFIARHCKALKHHKQKCPQTTETSQSQIIQTEPIDDDTEAADKKKCGCCKKTYLNHLSYVSHLEKCLECDKSLCPKSIRRHIGSNHSVREKKIGKGLRKEFACANCDWRGNAMARILLHLIHHPNQTISNDIDVQILKDTGILK